MCSLRVHIRVSYSHIHWGCGKLRYCLLYVVICCTVWCWWHFWVSHFNKVLVEVWPHGLHIWTVLSSDMGDLNAKHCTFLCTLWLWWRGSCSCFTIKQEVAITQTHIGSLGSEVTGLIITSAWSYIHIHTNIPRQSEHHLPVTQSTPCVTFVAWYTWKISALIVFSARSSSDESGVCQLPSSCHNRRASPPDGRGGARPVHCFNFVFYVFILTCFVFVFFQTSVISCSERQGIIFFFLLFKMRGKRALK